MIKYTCILFAASALISSAAYSQSLTDNQTTVHVRYDDLDLSRASAIDTLRHRIDLAVHQACGREPSAQDLAGSAAYRQCLSSAQQSASNQMAAAIAESRTALAKR